MAGNVVVNSVCAVVVLSLMIVCPAAAQPGGKAIGLLALRQLDGELCKKPPPGEIPLYAAPESPEPIGWIRADRHPASDNECYSVILNVHRRLDRSVGELPTDEYEEEQPHAAIVVERRGRWFNVQVPDGRAWLRASDRDEYFSLRELLLRRQAYLTEAWDGTLAQVPRGPSRRPPPDPRRRVIGYVTLPVEGPTWVQALERPDRGAPVIAQFEARSNDAGPLRSERTIPPQVPVFERRPGWLAVALDKDHWTVDQRVWIEEAPWRFHTFDSDAARTEFEVDVFGPEHSEHVRLVDLREVGGALWLRVEVMSHTTYESLEPPIVVAAGWVPAHDRAGRVVVWFFSRD
jgi:hypothetical protein